MFKRRDSEEKRYLSIPFNLMSGYENSKTNFTFLSFITSQKSTLNF